MPVDRAIDGVDLLPYVNGETFGEPHEALFWRTGNYRTVRSGDWKLQLSDPEETPFLYNLAVDPTEQRNLAAYEPEQLARLKLLIDEGLREWTAPMQGPLVGPLYPDKHLNEPLDKSDVPVYWYN